LHIVANRKSKVGWPAFNRRAAGSGRMTPVHPDMEHFARPPQAHGHPANASHFRSGFVLNGLEPLIAIPISRAG
jgi:hypothetical protein